MSLADHEPVEDDRALEVLKRRDMRIAEQERTIKRLIQERDRALEQADVTQAIVVGNQAPPRWLTPKRRTKGEYHVTAGLLLSDLHLDEVVEPAAMSWINAYNREIAEQRFAHVIETAIRLTSEFMTGVTYDGCVVLWAGDVFSGLIHEELRETNVAPILGSMHYWEPIVAGAFSRLADVYGRLHVAVTYGNHGRLTLKPKAKQKAQDSFEWLFAHNVAAHFRDDKRVTFSIPDAPHQIVQVYNHRTRLEHGNLGMRGGSGIAGALSPLMLGVHRATRQAAAEGQQFDVMAVGHWHQYMMLPSRGIIVNGSLKGYCEYARDSKFEPEPAQQAFWLWTPEHGISFSAPLIAQDRAREGW